jgi:hypothetical protein
MKKRYTIVASLFIALILSFINNQHDGIENARFYLGLYDREQEIEAIHRAVLDYNKYSSSFYNTGGYLEGLGDIPAAPLVKRRHFQDINILKGDGLVMVFDRDRLETKNIFFIDRKLAVAETEEVWAISLQEFDSRKPVFNAKALTIRARYLFRKEKNQADGYRWIAHEVDVYPEDEHVPALNLKPVL